MKIAITSQNKKHITGHAGKCRKFWLLEIIDNEVTAKDLIELPKEDSIRARGQLPDDLQGVDRFITSGMGEGMQRRLQSLDIDYEITDMILIDDWISGHTS